MNILVTGGAGFIGSHLAERLVEQGHCVTVIDDLSSGKASNLDFPTGGCHIGTRYRLGWAFGPRLEAQIDFVYHLAATVGVYRVLKDPAECMRNNIESLRSVLNMGIPGMFFSTSEVYGLTDGVLREDSPMKFTSAVRWSYAASKLLGEWMAKQAGWKTVRLFNVVGPRQSSDYGAVLPKFVSQALRDEPITVFGDGTQVRTFIDVRDCAEILDHLRDKEFDVVNVAGHRITDINGLAEEVKKSLNSKSEIVHVPYAKAYGEGFEDCPMRIAVTEKLDSLLQFRPAKSFYKTIRDLAEQIQSQEVTSNV